jgi:hypothetical protein
LLIPRGAPGHFFQRDLGPAVDPMQAGECEENSKVLGHR